MGGDHLGPQQVGRRHLLDRLAAASGHVLGALQRAQAVDRGVDDVDGVRRAERLGEDVLDAGGLNHGPDRTAGNDAGAWRGGLQHDDGARGLTEDLMRNGREHERDVEHGLARRLGRLGDGGRHLAGLALPDADPPVAVADDDHGAEGEAPAALDDLGHAPRPADDALDVPGPGFVVAAVPAVAAWAVAAPTAGTAVAATEATRSTGSSGAAAASCAWWWHLEL